MESSGDSVIPVVLEKYESEILESWLRELQRTAIRREELRSREELRDECATVLRLLREAASTGSLRDLNSPEWERVGETIDGLARARVEQGFSPRDTATFLFALRKPLLQKLSEEVRDAETLAAAVLRGTTLLDHFSLRTLDVYIKVRDQVIARQQEEMLELSTPVVKLWDGVVAMPLIGTLDSRRAQVVMETLLERIAVTGARIAIIDITGVPTVDTLVAQNLIKTVNAAKLMGADCILSGIRPQIAQTIVQLGVDLAEVTTKASLADAFLVALKSFGVAVESGAARAARAQQR